MKLRQTPEQWQDNYRKDGQSAGAVPSHHIIKGKLFSHSNSVVLLSVLLVLALAFSLIFMTITLLQRTGWPIPMQPGHHPHTTIRGFLAFTSHHSILTFIIPVLVNFIEVKYQGEDKSPLDTHCSTTYVAVCCLLFYCSLAHASHLSLAPACSARVFHILMMLVASLLVAYLASLLFQGPFHSLPYFLVFVWPSVVFLHDLARKLCTWVQHKVVLMSLRVPSSRRVHGGRARPLLPRTIMDVRFAHE